MIFCVFGPQYMNVCLAGEVVLATRQQVSSVRLLRRNPCSTFIPVLSARMDLLLWVILHLIISGQRLLPAIRPVTWLTSQRTEYGILPGGIPSLTINIPKPKTIFRERWWEYFYFTWSVSERMLFFLGPRVDPESKSAWACQSEVGVLRGSGPQHRGVPYLLSVRA